MSRSRVITMTIKNNNDSKHFYVSLKSCKLPSLLASNNSFGPHMISPNSAVIMCNALARHCSIGKDLAFKNLNQRRDTGTVRDNYSKRGNCSVRRMPSYYGITEGVTLTQLWRKKRIGRDFLEEVTTEMKERKLLERHCPIWQPLVTCS